ncbi:helix-turn-helix domain-containing protein [Methylobacterium sp. WL30]|uniref:helix-turn-helix domain-containing protein n=1 Tax=unclassified Methylobacterium TaxID=2615210 RepID=UPI0011C7C6B3|nr:MULTISPECIES: helix-turn-helix domain-containing protein [unclassified Methylobacterium]TXN40658.1 helix-turn-helix domain-containing protein [Methylobacterium sp. WL93]TXN49982.1 helix-turn-helix domain-containing protein [Methylobacterium sp. WL119]TXN61558.1 helix-turn-helix domain-containing protein [Methylobacterium sp. WL30]
MNYAYEIRRQAEAAPRAALPAVASALWKAFGEGHLSEVEAEALAAVIEARQVSSGSGKNLPPDRAGSPRTGAGSRPRTDASMARRRRWAASGRLPPGLASRFTLAEQAVLSLVAAETGRRGDCRLAVGHLAAIVGVAETTVRNAIREARKLGLVTVEERRVTGFRNDTNVVRIVSAEWTAWLRLARKGSRETLPPSFEGVGCKSAKRTHTDVPYPVNSGARSRQKGCRQAAGDPADRATSGNREAGRAGRAMR